ncbi:MAG: carbohydrate kinase, partial [Lewinella sp.]|nr:carbohydrate kinase [Lewinella sp.]
KVALYDPAAGRELATGQFPDQEMRITAARPGWAEQEPEWWWEAFQQAYQRAVRKAQIDTRRITAIGISYQMHGLVCLNEAGEPLRPSIIWCDSRAVPYGRQALEGVGEEYAFHHLLNSPGNFTAAKLAWVKEHEPEVFASIATICLPGDYLSFKLTGERTTTISGLSEGIFYDFVEQDISQRLLDHFGFSRAMFPTVKPSFADHGTVSAAMAESLGLSPRARVTYKAGDQPNNALSLNVLQPGEIAATAGTSGVVYGVSDTLFIDPSQRVNSFAHVNYERDRPRIGILLCINGTGIANAWAHKWTGAEGYPVMNEQAAAIAAGAEGLTFFPFGNGAERMLGNASVGAGLQGLNFNTHTPAHLYRAVQEGIAYAFIYGMEAFRENDISPRVIRAGRANMFLSPLFTQVLSTLSGVDIELYDTDGALGAARGAWVGAGEADLATTFASLDRMKTYRPASDERAAYQDKYQNWKARLQGLLQYP